MAEAILKNMHAIAQMYGGSILDTFADYGGDQYLAKYAPEFSREAQWGAMQAANRFAEDKFDRLYPRPEEDTDLSWFGHKLAAKEFERDQLLEALRNMGSEVSRLRMASWNDKMLESAGTILRGLVKYGVSRKLGEVMEPEGEKPIYRPQIPKMEYKKNR